MDGRDTDVDQMRQGVDHLMSEVDTLVATVAAIREDLVDVQQIGSLTELGKNHERVRAALRQLRDIPGFAAPREGEGEHSTDVTGLDKSTFAVHARHTKPDPQCLICNNFPEGPIGPALMPAAARVVHAAFTLGIVSKDPNRELGVMSVRAYARSLGRSHTYVLRLARLGKALTTGLVTEGSPEALMIGSHGSHAAFSDLDRDDISGITSEQIRAMDLRARSAQSGRQDAARETVLPDLLVPGLNVVFCGTAVATASAERGHYYAGPGNKFWKLLHEAGFTPTQLRPEDDGTLPSLGLGITDLVKDIAQSHDRGLDYGKTSSVASHIEEANPRWVAFNGLTAGRAAARQLGRRSTGLGKQAWTIGQSAVFILPSSSGAHAVPYSEKLRWWTALADLVKESAA